MQGIRVKRKIQENADANGEMKTQKGREEKDVCSVAILFIHPVPPRFQILLLILATVSFCCLRLSSPSWFIN